LAALKREQDKRDHERRDKDKKDKDKKGGCKKGPPKGGKSSGASKDANRKSKVTKYNPPTRTTRSMTRMFNYHVEMNQTTIDKDNPDGPLL
jgi:hypothetical protein